MLSQHRGSRSLFDNCLDNINHRADAWWSWWQYRSWAIIFAVSRTSLLGHCILLGWLPFPFKNHFVFAMESISAETVFKELLEFMLVGLNCAVFVTYLSEFFARQRTLVHIAQNCWEVLGGNGDNSSWCSSRSGFGNWEILWITCDGAWPSGTVNGSLDCQG